MKTQSYVNIFRKYWQYFIKVPMSFKLLRKDKFWIIYQGQRKQKTRLGKPRILYSVFVIYMESFTYFPAATPIV